MSISRDYLVWFDPAICLEGALSKEWSSHCKTYIDIYSKRERKSSRLSACPPAPTWCAKSSDGSSVDTHLGERHMISCDLLKLGLMTCDPMIVIFEWHGLCCHSPRLFTKGIFPEGQIESPIQGSRLPWIRLLAWWISRRQVHVPRCACITHHSHGKSRRFWRDCECSY